MSKVVAIMSMSLAAPKRLPNMRIQLDRFARDRSHFDVLVPRAAIKLYARSGRWKTYAVLAQMPI